MYQTVMTISLFGNTEEALTGRQQWHISRHASKNAYVSQMLGQHR